MTIENDVNAEALGELWLGGLKGCKHAMFLAFGTSVGGAMIINGKLYKGLNDAAGEVGYMLTHGQRLYWFLGKICLCKGVDGAISQCSKKSGANA